MINNSRTKNSAMNIMFAFGGQFVSQIMGFIVRTVFIKMLSIEYLGVNGLFTNILSMLSLAELGVGSALIYLMYKPMAENDTIKVKKYMFFYKRIYRVLGIIVLVLGFSLTPFLGYFIAKRPSIDYLELIYVLYVIQSASSFFFAYKQSVFQADQRQYIINQNYMIFTFIRSILQIVILLVSRNFIMYLIISVLCNYAQNIYIAYKADKQYPFLKDRNEEGPSREEIREVTKNIGAMFMHKIGSVILNSSDNLILSKVAGITTVGLYSNYSMIIVIVRNVLNSILDGVLPSIGNLCASSPKEKIYRTYRQVSLVNMWITTFCSISLVLLINPFITLWIGDNYLIDRFAVWSIVISFYIQTSMRQTEIFRSATGLFYKDRYVPLIQCIINVMVALILVKSMGIAGVFIGTSVAMLLTSFWIQPYLVYKNIFQIPVRSYFVGYIGYLTIGVISYMLTRFVIDLVLFNGIISFFCKMACCAIIPNALFFCVFFNSEDFQLIREKISPLLNKVFKRK